MQKDTNVIKSIKIISFFTSLSRILGYLRSVALAIQFGTSMIADAFFIAFRLPNTMRKLFGEGALSSAFIPVFNEINIKKNKDEAFKFANKLFSCLGIILFFLCISVYFFAPLIVKILAPGFTFSPEKLEITITLLRYLFPYLFFIALTSLAMAMLHSYKQFAISSFSPILFNISFIFSIFFLGKFFSNPIMGIVIGVLSGGALQFLIHFYALKKLDFKFSFDPDFKDILVKKVTRLVIPSIFSLAIVEINFLVNNVIASYESIVGKGAISALFYANFLVQLPLAIFATSVATAFFPEMTEYAIKKDLSGLRTIFSDALGISIFIILPACVGLIILANPIIKLLYEHGEFTAISTKQTAQALIAYSIGLPAYAGIKIIIPVFYSLQDTKTPMKIGFMAIALNLILSITLALTIGFIGLPLAISLSAIFNFILLTYYLEKKIGKLDRKIISKSLTNIFLISIIMGISAKLVYSILNSYISKHNVVSQVFNVGTSILIGISLYFSIAYFFKIKELAWIIKLKKKCETSN